MSEKQDFNMEQNVLSTRFNAVSTGGMFGKCSFCAFRNMKLFCNKLNPVCTYISPEDDNFYGMVYWTAKNSGDTYGLLCCHPDIEIVNFFNKTPLDTIQNVARKMVYDALREKVRN